METYLARQTRAANHQRSRFLIEEWRDVQKPALLRINKAALGFLRALDMARADLMHADDIKAVDALATDTAGQTIDLIRALAATQHRELDDAGGNVEEMRLDLGLLDDEHATWEARWSARKTLAADVPRSTEGV